MICMIYDGYIAATSEARIRTDDATKVPILCGEDDGGGAVSLTEAVGSGVGLEEVDSRSVPASGEAVAVKGKAVEEVPEVKDKAVDEVAVVVEGTPTKSATVVVALGCELSLGGEKEEEVGT
mmetsp:Transcript_35071/g.71634  ORF Transcript_35071/g.71634 Transcript_35071/m.71634 type:complete len:122 (+) Transcript_35071:1901-2266(+)